MKKLLFVLLLSFASSGLFAQQVKANQPSDIKYSNGDSYGFYVDDVPGAVSYDWWVEAGVTQATIWPAWDTAIDLTFSHAGYCIVHCTITMSSGTPIDMPLVVDVYDE
ncbi:MAG: hypothetical protein ABIN91_00230 [Mucilaginibacter sp.]|uniref:hypothetical protein n=1 Tax=Mucilaginibacter sp. TaxID=1882438 RepID=UPI003265073F